MALHKEYDYAMGSPFGTRPIGRPKLYERGVQVMLTKGQLDSVEEYAEDQDVTESEAVRRILDLGIAVLLRQGVLAK